MNTLIIAFSLPPDTRCFGTTCTCSRFLVNYTKSVTSPTQEIDFLGLVVNLRTMTLALPQDKILRIQKSPTTSSHQSIQLPAR